MKRSTADHYSAEESAETGPSSKRIKNETDVESAGSTSISSLPEATTVANTSFPHCNDSYPLSITWPPSNAQCFSKPKLGLDVDFYSGFLATAQARATFKQLEKELPPYLKASRNEVLVMGKVHKIPRKQAAFGDPDLVYRFSGVSVPANPWIPVLRSLCDSLSSALGASFNFVLVNWYRNGSDHMGEHRDDEDVLVPRSPIAAVSLGQRRDLVFRHRDSRGSKGGRKDLKPMKICLEHGSLLVMNHPTNVYWYHSLPARRSAAGTRISLTYRSMKT